MIARGRLDWCCIYRTGTPSQYQWHHTSACTRIEADTMLRGMLSTGLTAHVARYGATIVRGLPRMYEYET